MSSVREKGEIGEIFREEERKKGRKEERKKEVRLERKKEVRE